MFLIVCMLSFSIIMFVDSLVVLFEKMKLIWLYVHIFFAEILPQPNLQSVSVDCDCFSIFFLVDLGIEVGGLFGMHLSELGLSSYTIAMFSDKLNSSCH